MSKITQNHFQKINTSASTRELHDHGFHFEQGFVSEVLSLQETVRWWFA